MPTAIHLDRYGPPENLRAHNVDPLTPAANELVIDVQIAGVNRADLFIRSGEWQQAGKWPYTPGLEAYGTVARCGTDVKGFKHGETVITMMQRLGGIHGERPGGYAQEVCVPARNVAKVPDDVSAQTIGLLGLPAVTAFLALEKLSLEKGKRILIHGGSSAVGLVTIQLCKQAGLYVLATGTSPKKIPTMQEAGASEVHLTTDPSWHQEIESVDCVFDLIGQAVFSASIKLLDASGHYLFVGGTSGAELKLDGWALMRPVTLSGYSTETLTGSELQRAINLIASHLRDNTLTLPTLQTFPLTQAAKAHTYMETGKAVGRVALCVT